jgi:hypothetical protein
MGTYPIGRPTSAARQRRSYNGIDYAAMTAYLEDMITKPRLSVVKLAKQHGIGVSTASNWFNVYPSKIAGRKPQRNLRVAVWLKEFTNGKNNLARLLKARPKQGIHSLILQEVADAVALHDASDSIDAGNERLVGPTGIGTFVPTTTDDLLVVKEEVLKVRAEAEAVVLEATTLAVAIDTVRDWLTDKDKLQLALGRIQSLEAQLKNSDEVVKRFQDRALAANQVHSRD